MAQFTNALIHESSPYLLQHAHNPVDWVAWDPKVLERAQAENKLLLISIGYAACHWCHVMEHECFEDAEVASVMNRHFINIKIDREERPDVDHIYMDALQLLTGSGGWPLNIVALPDGRPFWGATYVPKERWVAALDQLERLYREEPDKVLGYAENLAQGIRAVNAILPDNDQNPLVLEDIRTTVDQLFPQMDLEYGGYRGAPKFMNPAHIDFLLHYATAEDTPKMLQYVCTTLTRMSRGGLYDRVGGGFARYSVDARWHIPHFEKMLYDNAQLIGIYAKAYAVTGDRTFWDVVAQTIDFACQELLDASGGFYASLDADSLSPEDELHEGAFYVWRKEELEHLLGPDFETFRTYFNINDSGYWEHGNYVLYQDKDPGTIARELGMSEPELDIKINASLRKLKSARDARPRPRLDDKVLCGWNGLMLRALTDAHNYLGDTRYLHLALRNAEFLLTKMVQDDGGLYRNLGANGKRIPGCLEDYAAVIDGFIGLYGACFGEKWLREADRLTRYCLDHFYDDQSGFFFFSPKNNPVFVRRTIEIQDNVIPSSNSMMAWNLFRLGKYLELPDYGNRATEMVQTISSHFPKFARGHIHWLHLAYTLEKPFYEWAIVGDGYIEFASLLQRRYLPNGVLAASSKNGWPAILAQRHMPEQTVFYQCSQGQCQAPVTDLETMLRKVGKANGI